MNHILCNQTLLQLKTHEGPFSSLPYHYSCLSDRILLASIPNTLQTSLPIHKILREVSKLLLLNTFECSLLHYLLKASDFDCSEIAHYQTAMEELKNFDEFIYEDTKYTEVFVFVLLNGYYAKSFVNKAEGMVRIDKAIRKLMPSFSKINADWTKKKTLKRLTLQEINEIFIKHTFQGVENEVIENYNVLVDQILEMSKPYNTNKVEEIEGKEEQPFEEIIRDNLKKGRKRENAEEIPKQPAPIEKEGIIKKVETPNNSQEEDWLSLKKQGDKELFGDIPLYKQQSRNDMLNSVESFRNWNMNSIYDPENNFLKSSYRRGRILDLGISQPSQPSQPEALEQQSPPNFMESQVRRRGPKLRRVQSKQEL